MGRDELLALAINRVSFLRPREKVLLNEACRSNEHFARLGLAELQRILNRPIRSRAWNPEGCLREAEGDRKVLTSGSIKCTFYWQGNFPILLKEIYDPPPVLFYRGVLPPADEPLAALVGTRHPTGAGRAAAYRLAYELAGLGIGTVSGLARGIDAESHRGSLDGGGRTAAVLGNGIDRIFPGSSVPVGRRILEKGGCILSEFPPGEPPRPYHFPGRNRIISGLARTVVVIQAPEGSGALITAEYALEQGRDLAVHTAGLDGPASGGTQGLAAEGAEMVSCAADLLAGWGLRVVEGEREAIAEAQVPGTGRVLARMLQLELEGLLTTNNGEVYGQQRKQQ